MRLMASSKVLMPTCCAADWGDLLPPLARTLLACGLGHTTVARRHWHVALYVDDNHGHRPLQLVIVEQHHGLILSVADARFGRGL